MRFVADENFDNRIIRGLLRREPSLDIVRVQDLEIAGADDETVLGWAAEAGRVLVTHDQRTVPIHPRLRKQQLLEMWRE
jgi:predicted nuclease of predicted toxin-antitoxin system